MPWQDRLKPGALPLGDWTALAFIALAAVATRGLWLGDPVADFDEQLYSFIGWRMTHGELPFVDWWDRKPLGLFAIFAAAHGLLGRLLGPGPAAYQAVAALFAFAGAALVYALARAMTDRLTGALAGTLYLVLMAAYGSYSGQSEIFFTPLMLGAVWLLHDPAHPRALRRACWAMALCGLALQIKYTVLPQCLFLGCYALWSQWKAKRDIGATARYAALFALLGLLPTILAGLLYAALGQLGPFVFANFLSFFGRLPAQQGRWAAEHLSAVAPLAGLVAGGLYAAWRLRPPARRPLYLLFLGWAASCLATVLLPGTVYLYYYAALVPAAVLLALPLIDCGGPLKYAPAALVLLACTVMLDLPGRYARSLEERASAARMAQAIAPHVGPHGPCLWVFDGPTALYRMSGSCVPTRFVYPDHLNNRLEAHALGVNQTAEVARILAARPGAIVTAEPAVTERSAAAEALVEAALKVSYRRELTAPVQDRQLTVWVLR